MTVSYWAKDLNFKAPDQKVDIAIVGGGLVGLSLAYWLSELRSELKIIVVERSTVGAGASGRNAGFLTRGSAYFYQGLSAKWGEEKALRVAQFARESLDLLVEHFAKTTVAFDSTNSVTLFQNENQQKDFIKEGFNPKIFGFDWINNQDLPKDIQNKFVRGLVSGPEYKVTPLELLTGLKNKLAERKIKVLENVSAYQLTAKGIKTADQFIECSQVVLALNGYSSEFHSSFIPYIRPCRAQMLAVKLKKTFTAPSLYYDSPQRVYWRKVNDSVLVVGGKRLLDIQGEEGNFDKLSPVIQAGLEAYVKEQLGLDVEVLHRWSGIMGFTEHELPFAMPIQAPIPSYILAGFSGHGMGLGFRAAQDMAELIIGKKTSTFFSNFKDANISL